MARNPAPRQGRTFNRFGQIIILLGILAFGTGLFYWLTTLQWQGIAAAFICLITCIMMAGVVSMEVKQTELPQVLPWMPPDDPHIESNSQPKALPESQPQPTTPSTSDGYSPPPGSVPPDVHQKKDPFSM
jgi:predicted lipid-binding transport protein (Tim44 family)